MKFGSINGIKHATDLHDHGTLGLTLQTDGRTVGQATLV